MKSNKNEVVENVAYRARVRYVIPQQYRFSLGDYPQCFIGVSFNNENYSAEKTRAILQWIKQNFSSCTILLPDSLYYLSLQATHSLDKVQAHRYAVELADNFVLQHGKDVTQLDLCDFSIMRSSTVEQTDRYCSVLDEIRNYSENDIDFSAAIDQFVCDFISRAGCKDISSQGFNLSRNFILRELSVAACLAEDGARVSIYPGSIDIFHQISSGCFPGLPKTLQNLIHTGINFKKRKGDIGQSSQAKSKLVTEPS